MLNINFKLQFVLMHPSYLHLLTTERVIETQQTEERSSIGGTHASVSTVPPSELASPPPSFASAPEAAVSMRDASSTLHDNIARTESSIAVYCAGIFRRRATTENRRDREFNSTTRHCYPLGAPSAGNTKSSTLDNRPLQGESRAVQLGPALASLLTKSSMNFDDLER